MSAPRTPTRPTARANAPSTPSARPATPSRGGAAAAGVLRTKTASTSSASPQVKAALAALRKARQASEPSSLNTASSSSTPAQDPFQTPARSTGSDARSVASGSRPTSSASGSPSRFRRDEVVLEWAVKGEDKLIEDAKKSGRLNLASRSLTSVPSAVYASLLPRTSDYHPLNRQPRSAFRRDPQPDLTIASIADDEAGTGPTTWYEQQELKTLNLSSNEIERLDDEVGGFEELETLDLHNNNLPTVPSSLAYLVHLTALNLAGNRLSTFPLQLLNLRHLRDLNLSANALTALWPSDWKAALTDVLKPPGASPSATPDSPETAASWWDSFPSSPFHRANRAPDGLAHPAQSRAPFPLLTTLSVAENPLGRETFTGEGWALPPRLTSVDLSDCGLTEAAVPPQVFGALRNLVSLDLSRNDLGDALFAADLFPPSPPSSSAADAAAAPGRLFPLLRHLDLSLNPLDSLASLETFLTSHVRRPITYAGLPKPVQNLISSEERQLRRGRRIGVPLPPEGAEGEEEEQAGPEVEVKLAECLLREEQVRRRRLFAPTESSVAREKEHAAAAARERQVSASADSSAPPAPALAPVPTRHARTPSPSPPPSPSPAPAAAATATPARRPVVLEDWEIEAAAGLSTPAGRRRAAALAARERAERVRAEQERAEKERVEREREEREREERKRREEEDRKKREEEREVERGLEELKLRDKEEKKEPVREASEDGSASGEADPPPYSPRPASPPASTSPVPATPPAPAPRAEAPLTDPSVLLISSALSPLPGYSTRLALSLPARGLAALPVPSDGFAPPASLGQPSNVDLSRNALVALPLRALESWGWADALRVLSLARNRIAAVEVLGGDSVVFPHVEALDLAHNFLPSTLNLADSHSTPTPLLAALAAAFPALSTLNLQHNRLTSLSGLGALVLPSSSSGAGMGLRRVSLSENKIADVMGLCEVAERYEANREGERGRWRCEEVDLSMNEINKLPPTLGLLPPSLVLPLTGNTFRMPRREVYENAQERRVVPWLREWWEGLQK
ncbi:hypothetical protein JCM10207_003239 [Rhodosporidiobolus poonsookiae]